MISNAFSQKSAQEQKSQTYLCTFKECKQNSRWINKEADQKAHNHKQECQNHIIPYGEVKQFLLQNHEQQSIQSIEKMEIIVQKLNQIVEKSQSLIVALKQYCHKSIQENYNKINQLFEQDSIIMLNSLQIDNLINYRIHIDQSNTQGHLQDIIKECADLINYTKTQNIQKTQIQTTEISQTYQKSQIKTNDQFKQDQKMKFTEYYSYQAQQRIIITAQISQNEQYLAVVESHKILIVNLVNKQKIKELFVKHIQRIKFSLDSRFLVFEPMKGNCYFVSLKNLKIIYSKRIHETYIWFIKVLENNQILTCSNEKQIILTDQISRKQLLLIENAHQLQINCLEYDYDHKIIVSCSNDKSIKFFNQGQVMMHQQKAHQDEINYIQIVYKVYLLSVSRNELKIWKINYNLNDFTQIRQLSYYNTICCSQSIMNNSMIIKITLRQIQFLGLNLNLIHSIEYGKNKVIYSRDQLDTLNYIVFRGRDSLNIIKKVKNV